MRESRGVPLQMDARFATHILEMYSKQRHLWRICNDQLAPDFVLLSGHLYETPICWISCSINPSILELDAEFGEQSGAPMQRNVNRDIC